MYAVTRTYYVLPEWMDEFVRRVQAGFVPIISQIPGFVSYTVFQSGPTQVITLSVFDTSAGAEASISSAADWVLHHLAQLTLGTPEIKRWEVKIQVDRPSHPSAHASS